MITIAAPKRNMSKNDPSRRRTVGLAAVSAAAAAVIGAGVSARADINNGFSGFSTVNKVGDTSGLNGYSANGGAFQLNDGLGSEATSGYYSTAQTITSFDTTFTYQGSSGADGITFLIQNNSSGTAAIGSTGGGFGYGGITNSAALEFNVYTGAGAIGNAIGTGGTVNNAYSAPTGITLTSGDKIQVTLEYFNNTLTENFVDLKTNVSAGRIVSGLNISSKIGSTTGYVGFTGGTGGITGSFNVSNFSFVSGVAASGATRYFTPIAISGYNQQGVLNNDGPGGTSVPVTATMDGGTAKNGDTWFEKGWNTAQPTTGLPTSGSVFTSQYDPQHTFQMPNYSGNDVVLLSKSSNTATMTLGTPATYSALSFLESCGNGPSSFTVKINYSDGATSTTGLSEITPDWFNGTPSAYFARGRDTTSSNPASTPDSYTAGTTGSGPNLYEEDLILPDTVDPISSVQLSFSGTNAGTNMMIFALSGIATNPPVVYTYTGNGSAGKFDQSTVNFAYNNSGTTTASAYANNNIAVFDDTATDTSHNITVSTAGVMVKGLYFNNSTATTPYNIGGGAITGAGGLNVSGGGVVNVTNALNLTGITNVNLGTLVLGSTGSLASSSINVGASGAATFQVSAGAALTGTALNLSISTLGTVNYYNATLAPTTITGSGTLNLDGSGTGTALTLGSVSFNGTINGTGAGTGGSVTFTSGGQFSGSINDGTANGNDYPVNVYANNASPATTGNLVFNGQNSYSGNIYLQAGLVQVGTLGALGNGNIVFQGGSLGGSSISNNLSSAQITNNIVLTQAVGLTLDATNYLILGYSGQNLTLPAAGYTPITVTTYDGTSSKVQILSPIVDSAAGPSGINATGYFALTGANTYSGGTIVNAGTDVATNNPAGFGAGPITFNNGGIGVLTGYNLTSGMLGAIPNAFQFGSTLSGTSTVTTSAYLENGVAFEMSGPGFLGTGATYSPATGFTGGNASGGVFNVYAPSVKLSGNLSGGALVLVDGSNAGALNVLELSGNNTFTGPIVIQGSGTTAGTYGATLQIDSAASIGGLNASAGAPAAIIVASGGALQIAGGDPNIGLVGGLPITTQITGVGSSAGSTTTGTQIGALRSIAGSTATFAGNVSLSGPSTIAAGASSTLTTTGTISGTGPLTLGGNTNGTMILNGASTYTGDTIVTGEPIAGATTTITLGSASGISSAGGLVVNPGKGTTLVDLHGFSPTVTYLGGAAGTVSTTISNNGTVPSVLTISSGNSSTGAGSSGTKLADGTSTLAVVKTGLGNQTLTGSNAYSAGTNISSGTLTAGATTALGSGNVLLSGGTLGLNLPAVVTVSGIAGFQLNNSNGPVATTSGSTVNLTQAVANNANGAFYTTPLTVSDLGGFTASFTYTHGTSGEYGVADGLAFVLQNDPRGASAVGGVGGSLGYGTNGSGLGGAAITKSGAVELNLYSDGTGFGSNGTVNGNTNFWSFGPTDGTENVSITYNGPAKTLVVTITGNPGDTLTNTYTGVDFANILNGTTGNTTGTGYVGITAATGGNSTNMSFSNFVFTDNGATGGGTIANNVIVAPATVSGIAVVAAQGASTGSVGNLTMGAGSQLNVSAAGGTINTAYSLTTGTVSLPAVSTIDVAGNGTGGGTLYLGAVSDGGTPATLTILDTGTVALTASATSLVTGSMLNVSAGSTLAVNAAGATGLALVNDLGTVSFGSGVGTAGVNLGTTANNLILNGNTLSLAGPFAITGVISDGSSSSGVNIASGVVVFSGPSTYTGTTTVASGATLNTTSSGLAGVGSLNVSGTARFANPDTGAVSYRIKNVITVNAGGLVTFQTASNHSSRTLVEANSLSVDPAGSFNLSNNDLDLNGSSASLSTITQYVASGYNQIGGANWQGSGGIRSSAAAADTTHTTALGVIQNNQGGNPLFYAANGTTAASLFDGIAPGASDILVKYTYFGDANLDGMVDGSDYTLIDNGYASQQPGFTGTVLTGWYNGDFNYDTVIDGSDYALIDNAFNNQGSQLTTPTALIAVETAQVAGVASPAAVPEPASLGLIAVASVGLAARRRRR